ncbi:aminoacyl--tRNA ligase-related protein [Buchnera aphidicola (Mollitrichosiphum nigrofasciatum)]|uniref:aminoacyl--tRNA ligase-related protein n=1 Tax=Buchnera aphidicola TaxID=9 RepID=UPI0031B80F22
MRITKYPLFTIKEKPQNAELISNEYMLRSGIIQKNSSGLYTWLPLGYRILKKIKRIIRYYMKKINGIEIYMPILQSSEIWKKSGRLKLYGKELFKINDRKKKKFILSPTNEEIITQLIKKNVKIFQNIPILFFQIQTKFRDEIRPSYGVIRSKEFIMKDAYSFDISKKSLQKTYKKMSKIYKKIFKKMNVQFKIEKADGGNIGDGLSHEFVTITESMQNIKKKKKIKKKKLEIGHIFQLGVKYSKIMNIYTKDNNKNKKYIYMGCYGIGITRLIAAIIEQNNDHKGIIWPNAIAPFTVSIIPIQIKKNKKVKLISEKIYKTFKEQNIDVFFYDKIERTGIIFSEIELIGIPHNIIVSNKYIQNKELEYQNRKTGEKKIFKIKDIFKYIHKILKKKSRNNFTSKSN